MEDIKSNKHLKHYVQVMDSIQKEEKSKQKSEYILRLDTPKGVCNTLWIPLYSSNRTATINLNHVIDGWDKDGFLWGRNGNCNTPYIILHIPDKWEVEGKAVHNSPEIESLNKNVAKKLGKGKDYPVDRVLKADDRIDIIEETIIEMWA